MLCLPKWLRAGSRITVGPSKTSGKSFLVRPNVDTAMQQATFLSHKGTELHMNIARMQFINPKHARSRLTIGQVHASLISSQSRALMHCKKVPVCESAQQGAWVLPIRPLPPHDFPRNLDHEFLQAHFGKERCHICAVTVSAPVPNIETIFHPLRKCIQWFHSKAKVCPFND